jgi:WD40 repeat protein
VAFRPDGKEVLTGSHDCTARLWQVDTGKPIGVPLEHERPVQVVAFSPDGLSILTLTVRGTARLWDAVTGRHVGPPVEHGGKVLAAVFSPDGKTLLTGSDDKTARLWKLPDPVAGSPERLTRWLNVITGMELNEAGGIHLLDAEQWHQDREELDRFGGAPEP